MFAAGLRDTLSFGHVYAATREVGSSTRDQLAGVAVWLPPGAFPLSAARQLRAPPDMASTHAQRGGFHIRVPAPNLFAPARPNAS
jgi:hypothetical protein